MRRRDTMLWPDVLVGGGGEQGVRWSKGSELARRYWVSDELVERIPVRRLNA